MRSSAARRKGQPRLPRPGGVSGQARPVAAVLAVVRREQRLLLARRANPPDLDLWGFPGGRLEWGETLAEAACRELREETAVEAEAGELLPPLEIVRSEVHVVLCPVLCRWRAGEGYPADGELHEVAWLTLAEIEAMAAGTTSRDLLALSRVVFRDVIQSGLP